ncbi:MAG: K(+)-transporting ATPase subunit C [Anaerolineales bacterium]|nr:K(+)-transporting ATPase subunit C [Anaerolineales bacterium]
MWLQAVIPSIRMLFVLTLITGVLYPLAVLGIGQLVFPVQANGSLIQRDGAVIGSSLIGQLDGGGTYFWARPSAVGYLEGSTAETPVASGGSNLGPTSAVLMQQIQDRTDTFRLANGLAAGAATPADMVTASGSGLDPHISPEAALAQVDRVAAARSVDRQGQGAGQEHTKARQLGILGESRVNVLELNLALDQLQ